VEQIKESGVDVDGFFAALNLAADEAESLNDTNNTNDNADESIKVVVIDRTRQSMVGHIPKELMEKAIQRFELEKKEQMELDKEPGFSAFFKGAPTLAGFGKSVFFGQVVSEFGFNGFKF